MFEIEISRESIIAIVRACKKMRGTFIGGKDIEKFEYVGTIRFSDDHIVRRYVQRDLDGEMTNMIEFDLMTSTKYHSYRFKVRVMGRYYASPNLVYTKNFN